jgi:hypothetical protein
MMDQDLSTLPSRLPRATFAASAPPVFIYSICIEATLHVPTIREGG